MVFASTPFLFLFLPLLFCVYFNPWFSSRAFKNRVLLLFSILFYAAGEPLFLPLMLLSIAVGWFCALRIASRSGASKKRWLYLGVSFHVALLAVFKYVPFFVRECGALFGRDFSTFVLPLPIGISFFTFQLLSYLFDVYREKAEPQRSILAVGLYIALFPQLIAGPIVRYTTVEKELFNRKETLSDFSDGMMRFIGGLSKKVLIANYMAQIADDIFSLPISSLSCATAWLGALAYTFQIYFDFSGYSDMAIGLGRMFGFHFPENFHFPYIARSVTEFWRRWHISLSSWLRDYVYIPLGGNRVTKGRRMLNLLAVWVLTGLWHGAGWTFLCWGLLYFVLLVIEKETRLAERLGIFSHVYTLVAVATAWVVFRSLDMGFALRYIGAMYGGADSLFDAMASMYIADARVHWCLAAVFSAPTGPWLLERLKTLRYGETTAAMAATGLFLLSLAATVSAGYNPFIYFNF